MSNSDKNSSRTKKAASKKTNSQSIGVCDPNTGVCVPGNTVNKNNQTCDPNTGICVPAKRKSHK